MQKTPTYSSLVANSDSNIFQLRDSLTRIKKLIGLAQHQHMKYSFSQSLRELLLCCSPSLGCHVVLGHHGSLHPLD